MTMNQTPSVCLVTTSQPAANPRLVKEADALADAGYSVRVVGAQWAEWAATFDAVLLGSRRWQCDLVEWRRDRAPSLFWKSRLRHFAARQLARVPAIEPAVETAALWRVGPELIPLARQVRADLFIAHNIGALPAALAAGAQFGVPVGFDAEDFQSGQLSRPADRVTRTLFETAERRLIPRCAYVTAAAPLIGDAYQRLCNIAPPRCVLNVFPKRQRPRGFRASDRRAPVRLYWFSQTIGPDRGLEDAVLALALLKEHAVELHLRGRWQTGYETILRGLAASNGVDQRRIVGHAPADPEQLIRISADYDVGLALEWPVSTNNDILLSNKFFTYLLAGNAVVASRTTGQSCLAPQLRHAAVLCEPGRPDSLAVAIKPWLEDRERLDLARAEAWRLGDTQFNWDLEQAKFLDVIAGALNARRPHEKRASA